MIEKTELFLINPPLLFKKGYRRPSISIPIGLLYVYSNLKDKMNVKFIDFLGHKNTNLSNLCKANGDTTDKDVWVGLTPSQIREELGKIDIPKFVGIGCSFVTHSLIPALKIATIIKEISPTTTVVFGGSGVIPGLLKRYKDIDIVFYGEGEERLFNLIKTKNLSEIRGIEFRENGQTIYTGIQDFINNLDILKPPDYEQINMKKYIDFNIHGISSRYSYNNYSISFITSRGCPFDCNFCTIGYVMGGRFRPHSLEYVSSQIKLLKEEYKIKHFHIEDDNISLNIPRFNGILDEFKKFNITWDPSNGIMVNHFPDKSIVEKIKESGCKSLRVAPESGSQRVINEIIGKKISLEKLKNVIKWCYECDLDVIGYLVIGFPGETMDDIKETIDFAVEQRERFSVRWSVCMANPIVGTKLREYCSKNNMLVNDDPIESMGLGYKSKYLIKHPVFTEEFLLHIINKIQSEFV